MVKSTWGGARENCGRRAVYRGKIHNPLNVRVSYESDAMLAAIRMIWDISTGDLIEYLLWNPTVDHFEPRLHAPRAPHKTHKWTFRVSVAGKARLDYLRKQHGVSYGDVIETLVRAVPPSMSFPEKRHSAA